MTATSIDECLKVDDTLPAKLISVELANDRIYLSWEQGEHCGTVVVNKLSTGEWQIYDNPILARALLRQFINSIDINQ